MEVLPVGRQAVEQPGLGGVRGRPHNGVPRAASPSARPVVLHSVAEELSVLIHPHRHGQLVVLQVGQELLFVCRRKRRRVASKPGIQKIKDRSIRQVHSEIKEAFDV